MHYGICANRLFLWGNVLLRGELQKDARYSNFEIFESALYMKCGSMPLTRIGQKENMCRNKPILVDSERL